MIEGNQTFTVYVNLTADWQQTQDQATLNTVR